MKKLMSIILSLCFTISPLSGTSFSKSNIDKDIHYGETSNGFLNSDSMAIVSNEEKEEYLDEYQIPYSEYLEVSTDEITISYTLDSFNLEALKKYLYEKVDDTQENEKIEIGSEVLHAIGFSDSEIENMGNDEIISVLDEAENLSVSSSYVIFYKENKESETDTEDKVVQTPVSRRVYLTALNTEQQQREGNTNNTASNVTVEIKGGWLNIKFAMMQVKEGQCCDMFKII